MTVKKSIDHIAMVIDASSSMYGFTEQVIQVFDSQIAWLARRSKELDRDCRVSVYTFNDYVTRVFFDIDVSSVPSLRGLYRTSGWTALLDAVVKSQEDLAGIARGFGDDEAFLAFVLTDGQENRSRAAAKARLKEILESQGKNWTVAALVPDLHCKRTVVSYGFYEDNVTIWETGSEQGLIEAVEKIQQATDTHLTSRSSDPSYSGTRTMFAKPVDAQKIADAGLTVIDPTTYMIVAVSWDDDTAKWRMATGRKTKAMPLGVPSMEIQDFIKAMNLPYVLGRVYYRLEKSEKVDLTKEVIIMHRVSGKAYGGREARTLIGLSDTATRIKPLPVKTGEYDIYVKSTSFNRLLAKHSKIIVLN